MKKKPMPFTFAYSMRKCEKSRRLSKETIIARVITTTIAITLILFMLRIIF